MQDGIDAWHEAGQRSDPEGFLHGIGHPVDEPVPFTIGSPARSGRPPCWPERAASLDTLLTKLSAALADGQNAGGPAFHAATTGRQAKSPWEWTGNERPRHTILATEWCGIELQC